MADVKISALTPVTQLDLADEIAVVDKSDTTQAGSGSTRKTVIQSLQPWRNLVDNGACNINQRVVALTGVATDASQRAVDRMTGRNNALGIYTYQQVVDGPAGTEFKYCFEMLCTTADAAPAVGDFLMYTTGGIEGQFLQHLLWGTANAKPLTLGFWVKGSTVGQYNVELYRAEATARSITAAITINVAATWEFKVVTFPGDVTTVITSDAAARLTVNIWCGAGTNWTSGGSLQSAWGNVTATKQSYGTVNLSATINNYLRVTGIQLEVGSVATPYESRRFDDELRICQRYFWKSFPYAVAPAQNADNSASVLFSQWAHVTSQPLSYVHRFNPVMRATPAVTTYNPTQANGNWRASSDTADYGVGSIAVSADGMRIDLSNPTVGTFGKIHATASAEI